MRWCAEVKSKFAFFQEQQRERFAVNAVIFTQDAFCLIPKILNAVDVVLTVCKFLGVGNRRVVYTFSEADGFCFCLNDF